MSVLSLQSLDMEEESSSSSGDVESVGSVQQFLGPESEQRAESAAEGWGKSGKPAAHNDRCVEGSFPPSGRRDDLTQFQEVIESQLHTSWAKGASLARPIVLILRLQQPWSDRSPSSPRVLLLRAQPSSRTAGCWQKSALSGLKGAKLRCVRFGRYELRRPRSNDLVAVLRSEPPGSGCLSLNATTIQRLRDLERQAWGTWRRRWVPVLGHVCDVRWGPEPPCPVEVVKEIKRIAATKASCLSPQDQLDVNERPFPLLNQEGNPVPAMELRPGAHQAAGVRRVPHGEFQPGWVCAVCLREAVPLTPRSAAWQQEAVPVPGVLKVKALSAVQLPCGHIFHRACVLKWVKGGKPCPLGRCHVPIPAREGRLEMECSLVPAVLGPLASEDLAQDISATLADGEVDCVSGSDHHSEPSRRSLKRPPHLRQSCPSTLRPSHAFFGRFLAHDSSFLEETSPVQSRMTLQCVSHGQQTVVPSS